jgi:hypothetical protein
MRPVLGLPSGSGSIVAQPVKIGTILFINCEIGHWCTICVPSFWQILWSWPTLTYLKLTDPWSPLPSPKSLAYNNLDRNDHKMILSKSAKTTGPLYKHVDKHQCPKLFWWENTFLNCSEIMKRAHTRLHLSIILPVSWNCMCWLRIMYFSFIFHSTIFNLNLLFTL